MLESKHSLCSNESASKNMNMPKVKLAWIGKQIMDMQEEKRMKGGSGEDERWYSGPKVFLKRSNDAAKKKSQHLFNLHSKVYHNGLGLYFICSL